MSVLFVTPLLIFSLTVLFASVVGAASLIRATISLIALRISTTSDDATSLTSTSASSPDLMELMRRNQELIEQIMSGAMSMNSQPSTASGNSWLFDAGCCNHMKPCVNEFVSKQPPQHFTSIRTADDTGLPVSFSGHVSTPHIQLPDVLNIPKLSLSFVSVA